MRAFLSAFILLAIVAVFIADGASMYGAHRAAVNFSAQAAEQAAQTYVDTRGNEDAVHRTIQDMATSQGVELLDLTYHRGTTRWYEVKVKVQCASILLKRLPFFKDHLAQQSTAISHF
jgi:cbb3-type cytochrome oxidase subunit 3